jgi:hypothetical protein
MTIFSFVYSSSCHSLLADIFYLFIVTIFFLLFTALLALTGWTCSHPELYFIYLLLLFFFYRLQLFLPLLAGLAAIQSTAVKSPNVKRGHLEVYMFTKLNHQTKPPLSHPTSSAAT